MSDAATDKALPINDARLPGDAARRIASRLLVVGLAALAAALAVALIFQWSIEYLLHSYLVSFCFFVSIALGALFFVLMHHLTRAGWSVVLRRLGEAITAALPALAVVFLPIIAIVLIGSVTGKPWLYPWNSADADALVMSKRPYLTGWFFALRSIIYLGVWCSLAHFYWRRSIEHDETGDRSHIAQMQKWSGPASLAFGITMSFAAFDWIMTLDPHWFSTIFGVYFFSGGVVGFYAVLALSAWGIQKQGLLRHTINAEHYHDIGKLLFGFVFFWGYIAFSQYMLIWYANIPEETVWYLVRQNGFWAWFSLLLLFGHLLLPFLGLMPRSVKRNSAVLAGWSVFLLVMHWLDLYWLVVPTWAAEQPASGVLMILSSRLVDVLCLVGIGSLCAGACLRAAAGASLVPLRDPYLAESLAFENV